MVRVGVGSLSDHKVRSCRDAFELSLPNSPLDLIAVGVDPDVGNMPLGTAAILSGAKQRGRVALATASADYGVGIEGGMVLDSGMWFCTSWVVVVTCDGMGVAGTGRTFVPTVIAKRVQTEDIELGDALDWYFGEESKGRVRGLNSLMSNGVISRASSARDAVILALGSISHV
jgi:inosine/xanthosine triphosphatase